MCLDFILPTSIVTNFTTNSVMECSKFNVLTSAQEVMDISAQISSYEYLESRDWYPYRHTVCNLREIFQARQGPLEYSRVVFGENKLVLGLLITLLTYFTLVLPLSKIFRAEVLDLFLHEPPVSA